MNKCFDVKPLPNIRFGAGNIAHLPGLIAATAKKALLIIGSQSFAKTQEWGELQKGLADRSVAFAVEHIAGEPSPEMVDNIAVRYRTCAIGCVAAIGGGAVLDGGKAVAAMLAEDGSVEDYLEGVGTRKPSGRKVPFIAVPTTSGTGSEMTSNAVISRVGPGGFKKSLRHDRYIPDVAIVDPALTVDCPPRVTINCSMDCFTQLVESYLSPLASPFTDDLAIGALRKVKKSLKAVCGSGADLAARSDMAYAACISGVTLTNAGLGVIHGFASVIGGLFAIPHGVVCGTLMAAGNEISLRKLRKTAGSQAGLHKYANLGKLFSGREKASDQFYQDAFIAFLNAITAELKIELLSDYGVTCFDIPAISGKSGSKNNPVRLDGEDLEAILSMRIV